MRKACISVLFLLLLAIPSPMFAAEEDTGGEGWALDVKLGTLGIGADVSRSIVPRVLNVRAGASFFAFNNYNFVDNDIAYNADLKLGAIPIVADVFPFKNWFRVGGGVVINFCGIEGTAKAENGSIWLGGYSFAVSLFEELRSEVKVNRASPYFGIGFNNPIKRSGRLGFFADLGILYHGEPQVTLEAKRIPFPLFDEALHIQRRAMQEEASDYKFFPVIQLGLSYRF